MNGHKVAVFPRLAKTVQRQAQLGQQLDDLFELRGLIKKSQEAERLLTQSILRTLATANPSTFERAKAVAILGQRTVVLTPDPQFFRPGAFLIVCPHLPPRHHRLARAQD